MLATPLRYIGDGTNKIFPVGWRILGEEYVMITKNNVVITDKREYDIINNSIVFNDGYIPEDGDIIHIIVATTHNELGDLNAPPSLIESIMDNMDSIRAVETIIEDIQIVADNITMLEEIGEAVSELEIIRDEVRDARDEVADMSADVTSKHSEIVFYHDETKTFRDEAEVFAQQAGLSATSAEQSAEDALNASLNSVLLTGNQTIDGIKTFLDPIVGQYPISSNHLTTKEYVDENNGSNVGGIDADGISSPIADANNISGFGVYGVDNHTLNRPSVITNGYTGFIQQMHIEPNRKAQICWIPNQSTPAIYWRYKNSSGSSWSLWMEYYQTAVPDYSRAITRSGGSSTAPNIASDNCFIWMQGSPTAGSGVYAILYIQLPDTSWLPISGLGAVGDGAGGAFQSMSLLAKGTKYYFMASTGLQVKEIPFKRNILV